MADALQKQAQALRDQIQGAVDGKISAEMAEQMRRQAEALREQLKTKGLTLDQFKVDPKQMEELNRQMEQFQKDWQPQGLEVAPD